VKFASRTASLSAYGDSDRTEGAAEKLGDEGVEALIALLNEAVHHERDNLLGILAERFERRVTEEGKRLDLRITEEVSRLEVQIAEVEKRLDYRITEVEARLEHRIAEVEAKLDRRITEVEAGLKVVLSERYAGLVRWMFLFWAGQIGVIVALFALFL